MTRIRIQYTPPPASEDAQDQRSRVKPLTHHEILTLMGPFTERGRHADLSASQRADRRLVFKPIEHAPSEQRPLRLIESLSLELPETDKPRLIRTVQDDSGLVSTLTAQGEDPGRLLECIESVPVYRQFQVCEGVPVARSYLIEDGRSRDGSAGPAHVILTEARTRVRGINLEIKADRFVRHALDLRLTADPGRKLLIPEDLTAVLGWRWRPLREFGSLWRGSIRVQSREPSRTADIERKIARTVTHLARTLDSSPADFHPRYTRQRWRVTFQRAIPLSVGLLIIALTPAVQWLDMDKGSILRMLIFHAPPFMLVALFMMREMPRIEIPPIPRPLVNDGWLTAASEPGARDIR